MPFVIKRVYEPAEKADGVRVLVDRLWPRGLRKSDAAVDVWAKELTPTSELRLWFAHDPERWPEFRRRYKRELAAAAGEPIVSQLLKSAARGRVTLLYAKSDESINHAVVLLEFLTRRSKPKNRAAPAARPKTKRAATRSKRAK